MKEKHAEYDIWYMYMGVAITNSTLMIRTHLTIRLYTSGIYRYMYCTVSKTSETVVSVFSFIRKPA